MDTMQSHEGTKDSSEGNCQESMKVDKETVGESNEEEIIQTETMLSQLKITVSNLDKITKNTNLKLQESFEDYVIKSTPKDSGTSDKNEVTSVWRNLRDFELLRNYLIVTYPAVVVPPLPDERVNFIWAKISATHTNDDDFLENERVRLESFLSRVSDHSKLTKDKFMKDFVCKQENWRNAIMATGFQAKQDSWLKKMNAALRVKNVDIRFEQLKAYANHLQVGTTSLLKARAKVAETVFGIYKIHGNYARVFKEWSSIEDSSFCEALKQASSDVEKWTNSIDSLAQEEDVIAAQIKEYLHFADSLKIICRKHEAMQYDVEWFENQITLSTAEKERLHSGNIKSFSLSGMKARLLGADTPEQRKLKIEQLDKTIADLHEKFEQHRSSASEFLEEALTEVEIFNKRKTMDLKEIFTSYAVLQMKLHTEGAAIWSNFKSTFDSLLHHQSE